jgi:hypothetical protein
MQRRALDTILALVSLPVAFAMTVASVAWITVLPAIGLLWLFGWLK